MEVHEKLREFLRSTKVPEREIAKLIGIKNSSMSRTMSGHTEIGVNFLKKLKTVFPDLNIEDLFNESEPENHLNTVQDPQPTYQNPDVLIMHIERNLNLLKEVLAQKSHEK